MKFPYLRIGRRLALAFAIQIALLGTIAAYGLNRMELMQANLQQIVHVNQHEAALASAMQIALSDRMVALRNMVLLDKAEQLTGEVRRLDAAADAYNAQKAELEEMLLRSPDSTEDERRAMRRATSIAEEAEFLIADIITATRTHDDRQATHLIVNRLAPQQARWHAALAEIVQIQTVQNQAGARDSEAAIAHARWMMAVLACLSLLGSTMLAWLVGRGMAHPAGQPALQAVPDAETASTLDEYHAALTPHPGRNDLGLLHSGLPPLGISPR